MRNSGDCLRRDNEGRGKRRGLMWVAKGGCVAVGDAGGKGARSLWFVLVLRQVGVSQREERYMYA